MMMMRDYDGDVGGAGDGDDDLVIVVVVMMMVAFMTVIRDVKWAVPGGRGARHRSCLRHAGPYHASMPIVTWASSGS